MRHPGDKSNEFNVQRIIIAPNLSLVLKEGHVEIGGAMININEAVALRNQLSTWANAKRARDKRAEADRSGSGTIDTEVKQT